LQGCSPTPAGRALATLELGLNRPAEALARLQRLLAAGPGTGSPSSPSTPCPTCSG
jgi:hypothetical protein